MPVSKNRLGKLVANGFQFVSLAHGGGQDGNAGVPLHLFAYGFACTVGVRPIFGVAFGYRPVAVPLKSRRRVEKHRVFGGRLEAMPFFRDDMQQDRALPAS